MIVNIKGASIDGKIEAIPSKSYAHRISICNFLAGKSPVSEVGGFSSADISATENCLFELKQGKTVLDCGESGSTLRFLIPLCAALGGEYEFIGHGKLMERPNEELFSVMQEHGVTAVKSNTIKISGKLTSGEYRIRGDISSQYVTGLLLALPHIEGDSKIVLTTPLVSTPYVKITLEVLKSFGVKIEKTDYGFSVLGNQNFSGSVVPEGDWSNAAFFLALGAVCGKIKVYGLNLTSVQGDRVITKILKLAGAEVLMEKDCVTVTKGRLKAFSFDAEDCPDLVPVSAAVAAFADGVTTIKNIQRLKIKESDRVESTIAMLNSFGVTAFSDGVNLYIHGGKPKAGIVETFNDHRIAMAGAVLACGSEGQSIINGAQAVNKSYPTFFKDFAKIGGDVYEC